MLVRTSASYRYFISRGRCGNAQLIVCFNKLRCCGLRYVARSNFAVSLAAGFKVQMAQSGNHGQKRDKVTSRSWLPTVISGHTNVIKRIRYSFVARKQLYFPQ